MAKKSPWGVCTSCGWEHNEAREFKMCYACRKRKRDYMRDYYRRVLGPKQMQERAAQREQRVS